MSEKWKQDEEYMLYIQDLLDTAEVQALGDFVQHYYSTRLEHSINVSYTSYKIAKRFNANAYSVARAGLLHDLFYYDWRELKFDSKSHAYNHPRIALQNARNITKISRLEEDIIVKHMWGATLAFPRYKESYIVTFVDKYWAVKEGLTPMRVRWQNRKWFRRILET